MQPSHSYGTLFWPPDTHPSFVPVLTCQRRTGRRRFFFAKIALDWLRVGILDWPFFVVFCYSSFCHYMLESVLFHRLIILFYFALYKFLLSNSFQLFSCRYDGLGQGCTMCIVPRGENKSQLSYWFDGNALVASKCGRMALSSSHFFLYPPRH